MNFRTYFDFYYAVLLEKKYRKHKLYMLKLVMVIKFRNALEVVDI